MNHSILVISDDPEFARAVAANWQSGIHAAEITLATSDVWHASVADGYAVVILGPMREDRLKNILAVLDRSSGIAAICVLNEETARLSLQAAHPHLVFITQQPGWTSTLAAVSAEALRRVDAVRRAQRAERLALENQNYATLGRYMLEMRSSVNNALTSVLGNADLLLDPDQMAGDSREQTQTIHTMTLRLSEIMQRFSSLASEMKLSEKESQSETEAAADPLATAVRVPARRT